MSTNISKDYLTFTKKNLTTYAKLILDKSYKKDIFIQLLDTYYDVRYYNYYDHLYKSYESNINNYLKKKTIELMNDANPEEKNIIESNYLVFKYLLPLDDVIKYSSLKDLLEDIVSFRIKRLSLAEEPEFEKEFLSLAKDNEKRKKQFLESINNERLTLSLTKTNNKNVYFADLAYDITFPRIYSSYSINKVYHTGLINEDKLFIVYHLINKQILENTISGNYNPQYIVDFPLSIFDKKDKLTRLFNTIDSEIVKENIIIKFTYTNYLTYKDTIDDYIKDGYKFAIELDDSFDYQEKNKIWLDIFKYIIVSEDLSYDLDEDKLIIKK